MSLATGTSVPVAVLTPDEGHAQLVEAIAELGEAEHHVADAIWEAYGAEAWLRDNREHEHRYRLIMMEQQLDSIFEAYAFDEFSYRSAQAIQLKQLGRLRAVDKTLANGEGVIHKVTERASANALRPIATSAVFNTNELADIAQALVIAEQMADSRATSLDPKPTIKAAEIRKGMEKAGVIVPTKPAAKSEEVAAAEAAELKKAKRLATVDRISKDLHWLSQHNYRTSLRDAAVLAIRMLEDHPASIEAIRKALP